MDSAIAEGAGLNINLSHFDLRVEYNDNVPDEITGMEYIRKPGGLLFDLIALVQANQESLTTSDKHIRVEIDSYNKYVLVSVQEPKYERVLHLENIKKIDKQLLLNGICKATGIGTCDCKGERERTYFYQSNIPLNSKNADLIEFGVFPGVNKRIYSLTERSEGMAANRQQPIFTKVNVERGSMARYFEALSD